MTILFPHLPKTAGQTLVENIKSCKGVGDEFYHLAPNGRALDALKMQLEFKDSYNDLILFGHNVDEGLLLKISDPDVSLFTSLRSPLDRVISSYNMKVNAFPELGSHIELENYVKKRHSYICKWYCALFPSFISDPFDPCVDQAINILEHFSDVYFQEKIDVDYERFMALIGGSFDSSLSKNRSGISYPKNTTSEKNSCYKKFLKNDFILYDHFYNNSNVKRIIPDEVYSYHKWYLSILNKSNANVAIYNNKNTSESDKVIAYERLESLKSSTKQSKILTSILKDDHSFFAFEFLECIDDLEECDSMNIFDIYKFIPFDKIKSKIAISPLSQIVLDASKSESAKSFLDVESDAWLDVCSRHPLVAINKSRIYESNGDLVAAEKELLKLCQLAPHQERSFIFLAKFYEKHGDDGGRFRKCVDKILDLDPDNKWASNKLG
ncbi:tetratricopeptide repeat protein [Marinomonas dokdonensis]|uniref:tetratricopeptide repeat protein n=1 Tax=Marinomonas dokdonensis TaxID=328224 RepID=UPI0040553FAF